MKKLFLDAGTTWAKIIELKDENSQEMTFDEKFLIKEDEEKRYYILPSKALQSSNYDWTKTTGHMSYSAKQNGYPYVNEVVALAKGAMKKNVTDYEMTILDLGSRDVKWVKFKNKKFVDLDWNGACASATGATVEMLLKFYEIKVENLKFNPEKYNITCGIFGLEKIMDDVAKGENPNTAIAKFIHGIAFNAWQFSQKPDKIYLSGGFCNNQCFVDSLKNYAKVTTLGRFVLTDGLTE